MWYFISGGYEFRHCQCSLTIDINCWVLKFLIVQQLTTVLSQYLFKQSFSVILSGLTTEKLKNGIFLLSSLNRKKGQVMKVWSVNLIQVHKIECRKLYSRWELLGELSAYDPRQSWWGPGKRHWSYRSIAILLQEKALMWESMKELTDSQP